MYKFTTIKRLWHHITYTIYRYWNTDNFFCFNLDVIVCSYLIFMEQFKIWSHYYNFPFQEWQQDTYKEYRKDYFESYNTLITTMKNSHYTDIFTNYAKESEQEQTTGGKVKHFIHVASQHLSKTELGSNPECALHTLKSSFQASLSSCAKWYIYVFHKAGVRINEVGPWWCHSYFPTHLSIILTTACCKNY